jgi:hypothetical protein
MGANDNVADYMKPSTLGVYAYAAATKTAIPIPTSVGTVNVETNPYKVVVSYAAHIEEYVAQAGSGLVSWFASLVGAQSQDDNGVPQDISAGQIVVTLNPSTHVATVTYNTTDVLIYDNNGNYVSTGANFGLPPDLVDAMNADIADMYGDFPSN